MTLLDAHLEQISLCAASIAELPLVHRPFTCYSTRLNTPQVRPAQDLYQRLAPKPRYHELDQRH
jgi:hypothetical protein